MNQTLSNLLASEVLKQSIYVERYTAQLQRMALSELIRLDKILVGLIAQHGPNERLSSLLKIAKEEINKAATAAQKAHLSDAERLIQVEAATAAKQINTVTGSSLATTYSSESFNRQVMKRALVMGAPAEEWWKRNAATMYNRFSDIVRPGFTTGRSTGAMIADWRQQSGQIRRHAEAQVRTSTLSMANSARQELYERNPSVVKGLQALAVFDTRTSALCRSRSGMSWTLEGEPLDANIPFPGHPPWHWNCRTTLVPILKSFEELGIKTKGEVPPRMRASMNGQVAEDMTYDEFFQTLTPEEQEEILGPAKLRLYKKGKLSMRDMVDQSGRPLTIDELESML